MDPSSAISIPHQLWRWYVDYLVYYTPDSWVASAARTFRILGVLMLLPFALLTLLDVTSYVIARTLGVIDDTRASTSDQDKTDTMMSSSNPTILVSDESRGAALDSDLPTPSTSSAAFSAAREQEGRLRGAADHRVPQMHVELGPPSHFFAGGEDRLSGVGVFSPAASQPPSPRLERRSLVSEGEGPRRRAGSLSWQSTLNLSSGDSFTLLEGEEGSEGESGALLRKRKGAVSSEA